MFDDPARIDERLDSRSISFENPTGARGAGGTAAKGRKGAPSRFLKPGETVTLADIDGPGRINHIWLTVRAGPPEQMRALWLKVFYDGLRSPSVCTPLLDFFALPHGRPAAYVSALATAQEGRGFNAYYPMPFRRHVRMELTNSAPGPVQLYYQVDYALGPQPADMGYLHVTFRRENPTTPKRDFVIVDGLKGPGRFLGCSVGVRVLPDGMNWYGEGELKIYRDGDQALPTYCGTGLEDYVGSAWGMGQHAAPYAGVPVMVDHPAGVSGSLPRYVGFYRWHVPDPIVFHQDLKVTIQQIGAVMVMKGPDQDRMMKDAMARYETAGNGWIADPALFKGTPLQAFTIAERKDDYCAAAFVYCRAPQAAPPADVEAATRDLS
ncbi:MAG TPA: glycoside hydrolase family 172 protein [Phenylobacterium sp.]|nr:glycoside hydrolase family 172 protein [Phenylobacterium sp.]